MTFRKGESGNIKGRPPKKLAEVLPDSGAMLIHKMPGKHSAYEPMRQAVREDSATKESRDDSWMNFMTQMGTSGDKRTYAFMSPDVVTDDQARNLWLGDWICRKVIEDVPKAAFRRDFDLNLEDKGQAEDVKNALDDLGLSEKFVRAAEYERAYGGSALFPVTDDIGMLQEELDENNVNTVKAFHVLEPRELTPVTWYQDLGSPKFGQPELWRFMPMSSGMSMSQTCYIHESRLIIFPGRHITRQYQSYQRPGWGYSKLCGIHPIVRDFGSAWGSVTTLLQDFAQGVLNLKDYRTLSKDAEGRKIIKHRVAMLDQMRSSMRMMILDEGDKFSRETTPMGGLSDILHDFALLVSAAADEPVTVMFGMAPAGLNATGNNDVRGWYDTISSFREHHYAPRLKRAVKLYMASKDGVTKGKVPKSWSTKFPPLWEPSEKEVAETRLIVAQADKIYAVDIGSASPDDIAISRWEGDTYSPEMTIDWAAREAQKKAEEKMAKEAAARDALALQLHIDPNAPTDPNAPVPPPGEEKKPPAPPAEEAKAA